MTKLTGALRLVRWDRLLALSPMVLLLGMAAVAESIRHTANLSDGSLGAWAQTVALAGSPPSLDATARDYVGRLGWASAIAVFLPLWCATLIVCIRTLRRVAAASSFVAPIFALLAAGFASSTSRLFGSLDQTGAWMMLLVGLVVIGAWPLSRPQDRFPGAGWSKGIALIAIGVGLWVLHGWPVMQWAGHAAEVEPPSRQLAIVAPPFDLLLNRVDHCAQGAGHPCQINVYGLDRFVGGLSIVALGFLAMAAMALLAETLAVSSDTTVTPDSRCRTLSRQSQEFRRLLYVAALLLVLSVTVAHSVQQWPLTMVQDGAAAKSLQMVGDQWLVLLGTYWTLMLAAIFAPLALALGHSTDALATADGAADSDSLMEQWLHKHGLSSSIWQQCMTVLALLGPWLAGGPLAALTSWTKGAAP